MSIATKGPGNDDIDDTLVVNGPVNVRKTHPNLYRAAMLYAVGYIFLGLNFVVLHPTFLIFDQSNYLWGAIFLALGVSTIVFLNFYRRLRLFRLTMATGLGYLFLLALGTCQPFLDGTGSLQLPLLYAGAAITQLPLLMEPFINPWTAVREP